MGIRGPKPVDISQLVFEADLFARALYQLRNGMPGLLVHMKGGVWKTTLLPELREDEIGHPEKVKQRILAGQMRYTPIRCKVTILVAPRTRKALKDVLGVVSKHWRSTLPVSAKPELWNQLKKARSVGDVREVVRRLRRQHRELASILCAHPEGFLRAKHLPHWPKSKRPSSDNKRIQFLAKILAGLKLGIAPLTATKRLGRSVLSISDITRHLHLLDYGDVLKPTRKGQGK